MCVGWDGTGGWVIVFLVSGFVSETICMVALVTKVIDAT